MKKIIAPALVLFIAITSLFSCKKDNDSSGSGGKSKTELLTQAQWIQTNSEVGAGGSFTSDWATWDACDKDDVTTFKTDKTCIITGGAIKCDPLDTDPLDNSTWSLSADEKTLSAFGLAATINTLNDNTLVITQSLLGSDYRATFGH